ncbi:hypothetical protein NLJ89_g5391 [Agrocybe chaxingu]|uniref:VOC domain-containing protein n=1 Tax=Agrocybe chaxingu TaxID=84603 RepID=A0A9W8MXA1_9AGAR|nr:hypothetical protein NLJ89_g5391 [Agrocybe chaxingu]
MPIHHISLNVANIEEARDFYLAALKPLGYKVTMSLIDGKVLGMGTGWGPDFWLASTDAPCADGSHTRHDMSTPTGVTEQVEKKTGKTGEMHIAFAAKNREQVRQFHKAAIAAGGKCNGTPGPRPQYFATYYGAFVLDPDGRNLEAVCLKPAFLAEPWGLVGWGITGLVLAGVAGGVASWAGWL